jgi:hypothetical protein
MAEEIMMHFKSISFMVSLILVALFVSKPSRDDFDRELDSILRETIGSANFDGSKSIDSNLTALSCKLRTNDCLTILRKTYSISNKNFVFFTRHDVSGPGASIGCWGFLKQFICDTTAVSVPTMRSTLELLWRAVKRNNGTSAIGSLSNP